MTSTLKSALFCLLAVSGSAGSAFAQNACASDHARLCGGARGPAVHQCMKEHEAELSPACQAQRGTGKAMAKELHKDCKPDAQRLCQGVAPGGGNIRACLTSHAAELSPACAHAEQQLQAFKEAVHPGCHGDVQRLCQGVQRGGGRIIACLQSHPKELSPACKEHVDKRLAKQAGVTPAAPPTAAP
jgi:hypothetical protein